MPALFTQHIPPWSSVGDRQLLYLSRRRPLWQDNTLLIAWHESNLEKYILSYSFPALFHLEKPNTHRQTQNCHAHARLGHKNMALSTHFLRICSLFTWILDWDWISNPSRPPRVLFIARLLLHTCADHLWADFQHLRVVGWLREQRKRREKNLPSRGCGYCQVSEGATRL